LFNSPEESLGFILADYGFDVWLVNGPGTKYNTMHTSLSPDDMVLITMIYFNINIHLSFSSNFFFRISHFDKIKKL